LLPWPWQYTQAGGSLPATIPHSRPRRAACNAILSPDGRFRARCRALAPCFLTRPPPSCSPLGPSPAGQYRRCVRRSVDPRDAQSLRCVPVEPTSQRWSDLTEAIEGPLRCPLGNACCTVDHAPRILLGAEGSYSGSTHSDLTTAFPERRLDGDPRDRSGSRFLLATGGEKLAADGLEKGTSPKAD
jgi:hypothetical protein